MKRKQKVSKMLCAVLSALMLMQTVSFADTPKTKKQISAKFGEVTYLSGMKAWYNTDKTKEPTVSSDPLGWELSVKNKRNYIYVDVDDDLMYDLNGESVEIEVDYFDKGRGFFTLTYEGLEDATDDSDIVDLTDTGAWKTHTFYIQDALFKNGLNGADFRIAVASDFMPDTSITNYRDAIVFGGVRVRYADSMSPVQIKLSTDTAGNLFYENEKIKFDVAYTNKIEENLDLTAKITAVTDGKQVVWEKEEPLSLSNEKTVKRTYEFDVERFGYYFFRVEVYDSQGKYYSVRDIEFSYCTTSYGKKLNRRAATSTHAEWTRYGGFYGDFDIVSDRVQKAGYGRHRLETGGALGSGTTTPLVLPEHQRMLKRWHELGLNQTIILPCRLYYVPFTDGDRAWQYGPPTEEFLNILQNQLNEVVKICAPYADSYIMGNEQDHAQNADWQKIPTNYTSWLEVCWNAVRENDPTGRVLAYGLTMADQEFFLGTLANGARDHMDGLSVHTYASNQSYDQHDFVGRIKNYWDAAKNELGIDMPAATIGETGIDYARNKDLTPNAKGNEYVKVHCIAENSPEYVECVVDYATLMAGAVSGYGHLRTYRGDVFDVDLPYAPMPEYLTISCWNKNFGGDLIPHGETKTDSYRIFKFERISDGKDILAMWGVKKRPTLTFDLGTKEIEFMDRYGNVEKLYSDDGRFTINAKEDIQYIIGDFTSYEISHADHKWVSSVDSLRVVRDNPRELTVTSPNADLSGYTMVTEDFYDAKTTEILTDKLGANITLASIPDTQLEAYLHGRPGKSQYVFHDVKTTIDEAVIKVQKDGKTYFTMSVPVKETMPISTSVKLTPKSLEEVDKWIVDFELENTMSTPLSGSFRLVGPESWAAKLAPIEFTVAASDTESIILDVPSELVGSVINMKAEITLEDGTVIEFNQSRDTMVAVYAKKAPVLDGVISEGEWVTDAKAYISPDSYVTLIKEEPFVGADDLSGYVSIMWDENNCYLLFDIKDDVHNQEYKDGSTWQGDGLQYGFVMDWPGNAFTHLMAGLHNDGYSTSWVFASEKGHIPKGAYPDKFETAVKHENGRTIYEVRVDWALIMPLLNVIDINDGNGNVLIEAIDDSRKQAVEGDTFHFGVLVNDDDGNGRKGYIEYGGGISGGSSAGFREVMFFGGKDEE